MDQESLNSNLNEAEATYAELQSDIDTLKNLLSPLTQELQALEASKLELEIQTKQVNKRISEIESRIRELWFPHIAGAEKAEIEIGSVVIKMELKQNVSVTERDQAIDWLMQNGYKEVMKWDLHTQTMKAIARKLKEENTLIPGLKYTEFHDIAIK